MEDKKIRVAITHGDTNGVGYEVILKAFEDPTILEICTPIIYGSPKVAAYHRNALGVETQFSIISKAEEARDGRLNLLAVIEEEVKVELGQATPEAATAAQKAVERAKEDYKNGMYDVLVTAPRNYQEHNPAALTIMLSDELRVALLTNQLSIKEVPEAITRQKIVDKVKIFHQTLRRDLRIANPRIAVLSLNPKSGDGEWLGEEEQDIIVPAIDELEQQGLQAFGPYMADELFASDMYQQFDGILAMYHDQGMTAFRSIAASEGVAYTAGLPLVRTTPAHGVCYDIAGKGVADASPMRHAVYAAIDMFRNRQNYDEPLANPLPKLYHEKRDDSEKVRFAVPKPKAGAKQEQAAPTSPQTTPNSQQPTATIKQPE